MTEARQQTNLVLIGMPGSGKSTVGVLLAKRLSRHFIDTDVYVQAQEGRSLHDILNDRSPQAFREIEERYVLSLNCSGHVIATGGSVIYGAAAMSWLRAHGTVIYLDVPLAELERRLTDVATRGIVRRPGQSLADLLAERDPLYRRFADLVVQCGTQNHEEVVQAILDRLGSADAQG
jgi:shikimate kinase